MCWGILGIKLWDGNSFIIATLGWRVNGRNIIMRGRKRGVREYFGNFTLTRSLRRLGFSGLRLFLQRGIAVVGVAVRCVGEFAEGGDERPGDVLSPRFSRASAAADISSTTTTKIEPTI